MSRLSKIMRQNESITDNKPKKTKKKTSLPVYDMSGKAISPEKRRKKIRLLTVVAVLALIAAFLYLPQFVLKDDAAAEKQSLDMDAAAIRMANNALRDNPNEDFDADGLSNAEETSLNTNPWWIDTDGDGATDYCEVHVTNTNPATADNLLEDAQTKQDKQKEKKVGSPYKINNVILWANDYGSKSHGSVVETPTGYRFCGFNGYAQFTTEPESYAYKIENGVRTLLPYRSEENVWKVSDGDTVELYEEKLEEIVEFDFFWHPVYADSNKVTDILAKILPDKGFITATKKMSVDIEPDTNDDILADIEKPAFDSTDNARFAMNSNSLNDMLFVREAIDNNECVAVSLFNAEKGEAIAFVYGYTHDGDLLLADLNSLEPIGTLQITEKAQKIMDETGSLVSYSYFDFSGFGFDSTNGDRISFFASTSDSGFQEKLGIDGSDEATQDTEGTDTVNPDAAETQTQTGTTAPDAAAVPNDAATQDAAQDDNAIVQTVTEPEEDIGNTDNQKQDAGDQSQDANLATEEKK